MKSIPVRAAISLVLLLVLGACASKRPPKPFVTVDQLIDRGKAGGLDLENPFALDETMKQAVEEKVGFVGPPVERMRRLIRYLNDSGAINFQYVSNVSLTAREAFKAREGDCLSYTNLYLGLARHLKIPVYFVHVNEALSYYERDGVFFVSSHMAVGYGGRSSAMEMTPYTVIVDFTQESSDWKLWLYESIDDATAMALFYNNVAVDRMMQGDTSYAERLFTFLMAQKPEVKEIYNNLGVLYLREKRYDEALSILRRGIEHFPTYQPLYTNVIQTARSAGDVALAAQYQVQGRKNAAKDPFFLFNQGVNAFHRKDYDGAVSEFREALKTNRESPFLQAWLARAYLEGGHEEKGLEAFREAMRLAPNHHMLKELRESYPVLLLVKPAS